MFLACSIFKPCVTVLQMRQISFSSIMRSCSFAFSIRFDNRSPFAAYSITRQKYQLPNSFCSKKLLKSLMKCEDGSSLRNKASFYTCSFMLFVTCFPMKTRLRATFRGIL